MSAVYGKQTTYDNSTLGALRVNIDDLVVKYPAKEFPLIRRLDGKVFGSQEINNTKIEWKEEQLRPTQDTLAANISTTGTTTVVATTAGVFNVDDIIQVGSEQLVVLAVAADGVTLTVSRGWASTTPATASSGATIYRVSVAAPEGKDADGAVRQGLGDLYNRTQIFEDVVEMSGTEEESFLYKTNEGNSNSSNQITTKQKELLEMLQTALLIGRRGEDTIGKRRTMGGLKFFLDTYAPSSNRVDFGGAGNWNTASTFMPTGNYSYTIAQQKLDDLIQAVVAQRGKPTAIYVGYKTLRRMGLWNLDAVRGDRKDTDRGMTTVKTYLSQAGELDVVLIPGEILNDLIFVVDENRMGYKSFKNRAWYTKKLAENGDSHKWQVLGEYTFRMNNAAIAGYGYNLGL